MKASNSYIFVLLAFSLGSCVSTPEYPGRWASGFPEMSARADEKCDLTGSYTDSAEPAPNQKASVPVSLFRLLFPDMQFSVDNTPDHISLYGPVAGELKVVAWRGSKVVETRLLRSLGCFKNGVVMINPGAEGWQGGFAVTFGAGAQDNFLYRGSDGWLILKRNDLKVVVPWFDYETSWYRFRPVDSSQ